MSLLTVTSTGALLLVADGTSVSSKLRDGRHKEGIRKKKQMVEPQQQDWSPNDSESPFYVWHLIRDEEWRVISKAYPYSVRALIQLHDETRWSEEARTSTQEQANDLMQGLAHRYKTKEWWIGWVVMESDCLSNQVYEKPILWYPNQDHVLAALRQAKLLKIT